MQGLRNTPKRLIPDQYFFKFQQEKEVRIAIIFTGKYRELEKLISPDINFKFYEHKHLPNDKRKLETTKHPYEFEEWYKKQEKSTGEEADNFFIEMIIKGIQFDSKFL